MLGHAQCGFAASCLILGLAVGLAAQQPPKSWFQQTQLDLGKVRDKRKLTATFSFVNSTGKAQQWFNLSGS